MENIFHLKRERIKGRGRLRLEIGPPLESPRRRPATINSNSLISKNNKSDLPGGSIPYKITHVSTSNLSEAHLSGTLRMSTDDACALWKSVRPIQFFMLYNFPSSTAAPQGGPGSGLNRKPSKIRDFACSGPFPRFLGHPGRYSPTLEIYQTDTVFHALQLCKQYHGSPRWPWQWCGAKTIENPRFCL